MESLNKSFSSALFLFSLSLVLTLWVGSCDTFDPSNSTGNADNTDFGRLNGTQIPTTAGEGTGGPAVLLGQIQNNRQEAVSNAHIFVFNPSDYADTLASVMITSSDGSFRVTQLPVGSVDIIVTAPDYFTQKKAERLLVDGDNTLPIILQDDTPYSRRGLRGEELPNYVPNMVTVEFKNEAIDSISANNILQEYNCSVRKVITITDFPRPLFEAIIPDDKTVPNMITLLSFNEQIYTVRPNYLYTSQ